jgi:hypothetical protein
MADQAEVAKDSVGVLLHPNNLPPPCNVSDNVGEHIGGVSVLTCKRVRSGAC